MTEIDDVVAAPLLILIEPVGAVLSSLMLLAVLCGDCMLPIVSTAQYSSMLFEPSVEIIGCPSVATVLVAPLLIL